MDYQKYFINSSQEKDYQEIKQNSFFMNIFALKNLCPFASHAIFPYVFSFKKGSWFRWEKSKNSVVAQCPNPDDSVAFRIIRDPSGSILAKVISQKGTCIASHKEGDLFELSQASAQAPQYSCCYLNNSDSLLISIVSHSRLCRYYNKPGQMVLFKNMIPPGFCLPAYYAVYPYALSLLYDGLAFKKIGREKIAELSCSYQDSVKIQVRTKKNILSSILNCIEKILRYFGLPKDVLDKSIEIEVTGLNGNCPQNLKVGQKFKFNLYDRQQLCPAVFYNLFPFLCMFSKRIFPYWAKDRKEIDIHCPDAAADIIYRIQINGK